jgi:hypothetical protein
MCFSPYGSYEPRPVREGPHRPAGAGPSTAELDPDLFGPKPTPPAWHGPESHTHTHTHNGADEGSQSGVGTQAAAVAAVFGAAQTREATIVELADGSRVLICPI